MPGFVQRVGDPNAGGGLITSGNFTVLVNGRPVATTGSAVSPHPPCPKGGVHCTAKVISSNFSVLVGGKPIATTGDVDTCGHPRSTGSFTVIVGGKPGG
jgi:uncharacterized Zn-binding protein involved in type VI secretion